MEQVFAQVFYGGSMISIEMFMMRSILVLLFAAPTSYWSRCCRHNVNYPQASSVMDFCRPDNSYVSVDTVHSSLL